MSSMLSHLVRRVVARGPDVRAYSSQIRDASELINILEDQGNVTPPKYIPPQSTSPYSINRSTPPWKPFPDFTHVNPHHLTYNARINTPPPPRKRQTMGPGSREARAQDVFYQLDLDPLEECQNADLLACFVTAMGKIHGREKTRLTTKNQRRLGRAIRRAKQMGIIPILSRSNTGGRWKGRIQ